MNACRYSLTWIVLSLFVPAISHAQINSAASTHSIAPIPAAILSAKKIFLANGGADSGLFPQPFTGDPARAYNQLYATFKASGRYELVSDPGDADLVLEIQLTAPNGPTQGNKQYGASDPVPMFRLSVYERKTHYLIWALTSSVGIAFKQQTHDRNFDEALILLFDEFQALSHAPDAAP